MRNSIIKVLGQSLGLAVVMALPLVNPVKADGYTPKAVVEMFTSQGCSSCPPADKIMAGYSKNKDILSLSWHVDYWNYLGWKDTFSKVQFTDRQRRYANSLKERQIYTPQAIVNGRDHAVGSRKGKIDGMMKGFSSSGKGLSVPISVKTTKDKLQIRVTNGENLKNHPTLYMVYFNNSEKVKIERGENRGKTITYHNIVQETQMLGMLKDGAISVDLPLSEIKRAGFDSCAVLLQERNADGSPGAIIGASVVENIGA